MGPLTPVCTLLSGGSPKAAPSDAFLFPYLEAVAFVHLACHDPELVTKASLLLERALQRNAGKDPEILRSFILWTPLLQHVPAFAAVLGSAAKPGDRAG